MTLGERFPAVLVAAQAGDDPAWSELYADLSPALLGYLRARGASDPEDALGEVFLGVARRIASFRGDEAAFRGWAFLIARNRVVDDRRRRSRRPTEPLDSTPDPSDPRDVESEALARLAGGEVAALLAELTVEQRDVLLLRIVGDLSLEQTARALDKRVGAVKQLQHRALASLRRALDERGRDLDGADDGSWA